jgi:hypothetical protein
MRCVGDALDEAQAPEVFPGPFTALDAKYVTTCGLKPDGHPSCWWCDERAVESGWGLVPDLAFAQLGVGNSGGCGVLLDGTVACWGTATPVLEVPEL